METPESKRGRNNRSRGLSIERKVRDIFARLMQTETWRNPATGTAIADVETRTGVCPMCQGHGKLLLAIEVKSFQGDIPKWLQRGLGQNEAAVAQTGKTGIVVVSWVNKAKRRYFGLFEIN